MTDNDDIQALEQYHQQTKHSVWSVRSSRHTLDWKNQPFPLKIYTTSLEAVPLPLVLGPSTAPAVSVIAGLEVPRNKEAVPDLSSLACVLYFTAGITKRLQVMGGEMHFRAASCTGALYHTDIYAVCGDLPGLPAGVYHFSVHEMALRRLRQGDFRGVLAEASGNEESVVSAPVVLVYTDTFWRNSWKYQARAYRHTFWDGGVMLTHSLAMASAHELPARVVMGFEDGPVNKLLDLDTWQEVSIALLALGYAPERQAGGQAPPVEPLGLETRPLSREMVDYPAIHAAHAASSLASGDEARAWRSGAMASFTKVAPEKLFPFHAPDDASISDNSIEEVVRRRGSSRAFTRDSISFRDLSTLLDLAGCPISADFQQGSGVPLTELYVIAHAVDGLPPGAYRYVREQRALALVKEGDFRNQSQFLGLDQLLPGDAAVNVFAVVDLEAVLRAFGNRGYRAAQAEGGIVGGRLYLAAYALRLEATGLTFYDDEVTEFLSPDAAGKSVMFLTAIGRPARRSTPPKLLGRSAQPALNYLVRYDAEKGWVVDTIGRVG